MKGLHPTKLILGLIAPLIAAGTAWLAAAVGKYGVHLDPSGINALAVTGATAAIGVLLKLIHDVSRTSVGVAVTQAGEKIAGAVAEVDPKAGEQIEHAAQVEVAKLADAITPGTVPPAA